MIADGPASAAVVGREEVWTGSIFSVVREDVDLGAGRVRRDYIEHSGSVAVVALDEQGQVCLLRQYRHPVRRALWEIPAGLLDAPGESPREAAARELAEEADLAAATWHTLVDIYLSPGCSTEALRVYLARGLRQVASGYLRQGEEADLQYAWVDLGQAVQLALSGALHSPTAVVGVLGAAAAQQQGWKNLRAPDAPFFSG